MLRQPNRCEVGILPCPIDLANPSAVGWENHTQGIDGVEQVGRWPQRMVLINSWRKRSGNRHTRRAPIRDLDHKDAAQGSRELELTVRLMSATTILVVGEGTIS